jgi:hypothetical protein
MKLTEEIKRMRQIMSVINEEKTNISISCPKCNHGWTIDDKDEDPYLCHNCGYDKLERKYEPEKLAKWKKENNVNENEDEDNEDDQYDDHTFDIRADLAELKQELIDAGVNNNTRLHLTHDSELKKIKTPQIRAKGPKPNGLWYCVGFGWLDFTTSDFQDFYTIGNRVYAFEISLEGLNILKITSYEELIKFEEIYLAPNENEYMKGRKFDIDWSKVAENYDGIEIAPYIHKARMGHMWYYGWDVASGCIWNTSGLKSKKLLQ